MRRASVPSGPVDLTGDGTVHGIPLPTPFTVGPVNTYVLADDPLTLVDCGPNSATALRTLEQGLAALGHRVEDVGLVLLTHQHVDHMGLAGVVSERSGAEVGALRAVAPSLEHFEAAAAQDDEYAYELMLRHGVDERVAKALRSVARTTRGWGAATPVHRLLDDGDVVELGSRSLRVLHRPGHSPSDVVLHDSAAGLAFSGDHLVRHVPSTTPIARPLQEPWDGSRPRPLVDYRASLAATRAVGADLLLSGHGRPVTDPAALIDERLAAQDAAAERLRSLLADGPRSAYELAAASRGELAITQVFVTLSEILGLLDVLVLAGLAVEDDSGDVVVFATA